MFPIRYGRLKKFRKKNKMFFLFLKAVAAWYLLIGNSAYFTGETNAYFNDSDQFSGKIQAGVWETEEETETPDCSKGKQGSWDCSSLKFIGASFDGQTVTATITNTGEDMELEGRYEIYFSEQGNPKDGAAITQNMTFSALKSGESIELTFVPDKNGIYKFKAYQHKDHPGKGELWSDDIAVSLQGEEEPEKDGASDVPSEEQQKEGSTSEEHLKEESTDKPTDGKKENETEEVPRTDQEEQTENVSPVETGTSESKPEETTNAEKEEDKRESEKTGKNETNASDARAKGESDPNNKDGE